MSAALDAVVKLTAVAEKLLREAERLRNDVAKLNDRVEPIDHGRPAPTFNRPPAPKTKWQIVDALNMLDEARQHIFNCEHELAAIRARIDNIALNAISREEMKPWIKR
jgi:hypothetical protein